MNEQAIEEVVPVVLHSVENHPIHRARRRFLMMIGGTLLISFIMVGVSLAIYSSSGAAQLDLSRPSYQSVRSQATHLDQSAPFPATGDLTPSVYKDYLSQYQAQVNQLSSNAFGGTVMSDQALQIDAPAGTAPTTPSTGN